MDSRILIVEDNADLAFGLQRTLEAHGHEVEVAGDGERALARARASPPTLMVLDLMLPGTSGFRVLSQLRAAGLMMPVLVLSARGEEADKVRSFRAGADDYVTKPFGVLELVERVHALLRRAARPATVGDGAGGHAAAAARVTEHRVGDVLVDVAARKATRHGRPLSLSPIEFDLLLTFLRHPGVALSRATLLRDVWGHAPDIHTRTVDLHVALLRRKLEPTPGTPRYIITVFKTGYRYDP